MPHNRSVDSDKLRQGAAHLHIERPLSFAVTGCSWPAGASVWGRTPFGHRIFRWPLIEL